MFDAVDLQLRLVNFFCIIVVLIMILNIILPEEKNTKKVGVNCCCKSECIENGK